MALPTHRLGILSDGTIQKLTLPRQLYRVKHDYELHPNGDFLARPAEVFRLDPQHYTKLTEAWQRFWHARIEDEMRHIATAAQIIDAWRYLTHSERAFTNGQGPDLRRDYITGERLDQPLPGLSSLICGGNVLAGVEQGDELIVETLDGNQPPPMGITRATHPHLIQYGTVSTKQKLANGSYKVTKFTVAKMMGCNAPVPILANREVRIKLSMLVKLPLESPVPSPYNV